MKRGRLGHNPKTIGHNEEDLLELTQRGTPRAYFASVEDITLGNEAYRTVIYTGQHTQLVLMKLLPGEKIDREIHHGIDQFFRIEEGSIEVFVEDPDEVLNAKNGDAIIIPSGTHHTITAGPEGVKLYTLYSPPNHPYDRVQDKNPRNDD
jgi:mannose-6-phosphate isomerase-like protein (cupin superfamily)